MTDKLKYNAYMRTYLKNRYENDSVFRDKVAQQHKIKFAINMLNDEWRLNRNERQRIIDKGLKEKKHDYYLYRKALKGEQQLTTNADNIFLNYDSV